MIKEIWLPINGYENLYEVSNLGRIKSLPKTWITGRGTLREKPETMMKLGTVWGYLGVSLSKDKVEKSYRVHRLVADAFLNPVPNKNIVNHINGIKNDNRAENLEWCTDGENVRHALRTGLKEPLKGDKHPSCILSDEDVIRIREMSEIHTQKEIGEKFGVDRRTVGQIINRKRWKHI